MLGIFPQRSVLRDLKSLNILMNRPIRDAIDSPVVKVADLGLARMMDLGDFYGDHLGNSILICLTMIVESSVSDHFISVHTSYTRSRAHALRTKFVR